MGELIPLEIVAFSSVMVFSWIALFFSLRLLIKTFPSFLQERDGQKPTEYYGNN